MSKLSRVIIIGCLLVAGCSSFSSKKTDSGMDTTAKDKSPKILLPKNSSTMREVVDATTMQTQADYFVTVAEVNSYEGKSTLAVQNFKSALVYDPKSAWIHYRLAQELLKSGQLVEAKTVTETALKLKPVFNEVRVLRATLFMAEKKYADAMKEYQIILTQDPHSPEALMYLGAIYSELKDFTKAKSYFLRLSQSPKFANTHLAHYYLGRLAMEERKKGSFDVALKHFLKSLEERPDFAESALAVGQIYLIQGYDKKAFQHYKTFQQKYGPIAKIAEILSQQYLTKSQYDEAFEQLEILEQSGDDPLSAKLKMALILVEKNLYPEAIVKFKEIEKEAPESDKVKFYLAAIYEEQKNIPEAISYFKQVPRDSSYYGESVMHLALLYQNINKTELSRATLAEAVANKVNHPPVYMLYSSYLEQDKNLKASIEIMIAATDRFSDSAQAHFYLGTLYDKANEKDKMVASLRTSVDLDQSNPQVLNYLAYSLAEMNQDLEQAEIFAKKAVKVAPKDPYILDTLGWVQFKRGNIKEALIHLHKAYSLDPEVSVFSEHLAEVYLVRNDEIKAREYFIKAYENEENLEKKNQLKERIAFIENKNNIATSDRFPASVSSSNNEAKKSISGSPSTLGSYKEK